MPNNTTTFNSKTLTAALVTVLVLFFATELLLYANRPALTKDYWNKFIINERELLREKRDYDYIILGDSIQKTGIDPAMVSDDILALGMPGGKPLSLYLELKSYLSEHRPPKALFLYIDPENPRDSLYVILRYFVTIPEFIFIWKDLTWKERNIFFGRYFTSLDLRKVGLAVRNIYPYDNATFVRDLIKNRGYMPLPTASQALSDDYFFKHTERYQKEVDFTAVDLEYLNKIAELAASKNIKIVFLGFAVPKQLYAILEMTGFNANYRVFYDRLKRRYPDALYVKEPILYVDNKYFGDMSHFNKDGVEVYSTYFKNQVLYPVSEKLKL